MKHGNRSLTLFLSAVLCVSLTACTTVHDREAAEDSRADATSPTTMIHDQIIQDQKASEDDYWNAASQSITIMSDHYDEIIDCADLYMSVWYNAIYHEQDPQTDKYTMKDGQFVEDFNQALDALYSDEAYSQSLHHIREDRITLKKLRIRMEEVPEKAGKFDSALRAMVDIYIRFGHVLTDQNGSYNSNNELLSELSSQATEATEDLSIHMDAFLDLLFP